MIIWHLVNMKNFLKKENYSEKRKNKFFEERVAPPSGIFRSMKS